MPVSVVDKGVHQTLGGPACLGSSVDSLPFSRDSVGSCRCEIAPTRKQVLLNKPIKCKVTNLICQLRNV